MASTSKKNIASKLSSNVHTNSDSEFSDSFEELLRIVKKSLYNNIRNKSAKDTISSSSDSPAIKDTTSSDSLEVINIDKSPNSSSTFSSTCSESNESSFEELVDPLIQSLGTKERKCASHSVKSDKFSSTCSSLTYSESFDENDSSYNSLDDSESDSESEEETYSSTESVEENKVAPVNPMIESDSESEETYSSTESVEENKVAPVNPLLINDVNTKFNDNMNIINAQKFSDSNSENYYNDDASMSINEIVIPTKVKYLRIPKLFKFRIVTPYYSYYIKVYRHDEEVIDISSIFYDSLEEKLTQKEINKLYKLGVYKNFKLRKHLFGVNFPTYSYIEKMGNRLYNINYEI